MEPVGARYWAFISYSHHDAKVASALQRAIETYRLPPHLVGRQSAHGSVPRFLKPVFRDREELQAGSDLNLSVRTALAQSRYLIVVCSPDAVRSVWVNQEIVEFKRLHGEERTLAVIVAGEPFASRIPGRETEECIPEALRFALDSDGLPRGKALEPVAADLRPQGDGKRLTTLKLVAGMLHPGISVDELAQRDAQRRTRRMATIAFASILGMTVMSILTVMAVHSRSEAQSQRAQAEDLIEFMLGDLRKRLEPVGRLDVLDLVGEKALAYYANQSRDRLDATSLGRHSRATHLIGEMCEQRGQLEGALAAFQSAADTTAQLLERAPTEGQRIFDHAQSVYWLGYIAWRRGQAQAAEAAFVQYQHLAKQLVRIDANNVDWQLETAYADQNLGVVQLDAGRLSEALSSFSAARDTLARLVTVRPTLVRELTDAHGWIAKVRDAAGDYAASIEAQQARLDVLRTIPGHEKDRRISQQLANVTFELGRMHLNLGNLAAAESSLRDAMARSLALVEADSSNMFWLSESCFYRLKLAEIEVAQGARDAARLDVEHAIKDIEKLLASDASALNWQINLRGLALAQRTAIAQLEGRDPPQREIEALLSDVQGFESAGRVLSAAQATIVAGLELAFGDVLDAAGQHDAARDHWRAAAIRLQTRTGDANYPALTLRARALTRLGERTQAQALFARIQASNYRHPAYAALAHELVQEAGPRTQGELEWPTPLSRSRTISFRSNRRSSTPDRETT